MGRRGTSSPPRVQKTPHLKQWHLGFMEDITSCWVKGPPRFCFTTCKYVFRGGGGEGPGPPQHLFSRANEGGVGREPPLFCSNK